MPFSYDKLWSILSMRKMSKDELRKSIGCSQTTIVNLGRNENVSLDVIDRICDHLNCHPFEILEYVPRKEIPPEFEPKRREIYLADFKTNDGKVVTKPVLIIQNSVTKEFVPTVIILPFTTDLRPSYNTAHLLIPSNPENGLMKDSILLIDNIQSIQKLQLVRKIGEMNSTLMEEVDFISKKVLGLETYERNPSADVI